MPVARHGKNPVWSVFHCTNNNCFLHGRTHNYCESARVKIYILRDIVLHLLQRDTSQNAKTLTGRQLWWPIFPILHFTSGTEVKWGTPPWGGLYMNMHCLFAFGAGIWNFTWGNEAWYRCPWTNIHFTTWIGLFPSIQSLARIIR